MKTADDKKLFPRLRLFGRKKQPGEAEITPEDMPAFEEKLSEADESEKLSEEIVEESEEKLCTAKDADTSSAEE